MEHTLTDCVAIHKKLELMGKKLVDMFNNNTGTYDGDPLFQPTSSPICQHWIPRDADEEEELFMNWNCIHPDADCDFGDADHCCIMSCPDEKHGAQLAGQIVKAHSELHPAIMKVLDLFNKHSSFCKYNAKGQGTLPQCIHARGKDSCCMANCPL
jgi:hypothetical protein